MQSTTRAALSRAGSAFLLSLLLLLVVPFTATAAPASPGDRDTTQLVAGDETVGVLPINAEVTRTRSVSSRLVVVERQLAGEDLGTTITAQRGGILLVARGGPPGQENATAGESWSASWVSSGTTFTVTIVQAANETDDQAADRLDRKVRAMQRLRPRDGASTGAADHGHVFLELRVTSPPRRLLAA